MENLRRALGHGYTVNGPTPQRRQLFAATVFALGLAWIGQMMWLTAYIIRVWPVPHPYGPLPFIGSWFKLIASGVFAAETVIILPLYLLLARAMLGQR